MFSFINKYFGGGFNARVVKQYQRIVSSINNYESKISSLSDEDLAHKTVEFKELLAKGKTLDDILPEAFAVVREASKRVLGLRHFDVQLIGGITLHKGQIAEMRTGEGKTLVATAPVYLNALTEKGVHVVTVNDYLAKRDGEQMGQVYGFLGLSTSIIVSGMSDFKKKEAYAADITYGTNHEFGFDYLRDNLKFRVEDMVMRPFNYAVVDEVDSILIDEARTPLIISGPDDNASQMYVDVNSVVKDITEEDYEKDPKTRAINLTEAGIAKIEKRLMDMGLIDSPLYDSSNVSMVYYVNCALKANKLFKKDVDYMVRNGQILIIDEFTGRAMEGRRYSEGLHQALEAKEGVEVQAESQTIASISYQNLFRMYPKLSGMTGTAMTEEAEFDEIYKLKVVSIPPNKPVIRKDHEDSIFLTLEEKDNAVVQLIKECAIRKQPVLVGTTNLDRSEYISFLLTKAGIKHNVLNAKQHEREAIIISEAGAPGAVTIATNMAGRGTDIKLGGSVETRVALECKDIEDPIEREEKIQQIKEDVNRKHDEVIKLGGLFVVGTERNESRRIDNQLRGRSGRQGDPGASKYFLSLEDDLIKRFGSQNLKNTLKKLGVKKNEDLTHRWISKAIEKAQQRVEAYNFDIRKHLLKYDDVMNEQRKMIYSQRLNLMKSDDLSTYVNDIVFDTVDNLCEMYTSPESVPFEWKLDDLQKQMHNIFGIQINKDEIANDSNMTYELLKQQLHDKVKEKFDAIMGQVDPESLKSYEKNLTLKTLDTGWKKHLVTLEHLRRGINLQSYAQKNPLNEYKFEAFNIFDEMLNSVRREITTNIMHIQERPTTQQFGFDDDFEDIDFDNMEFNDEEDTKEQLQKLLSKLKQLKDKSIPVHANNDMDDNNYLEDNIDLDDITEENEQIEQNNNTNYVATSRNAPCPCGSGMKYKKCHGKLQTIVFNNPTNNNSQEDTNTNTQIDDDVAYNNTNEENYISEEEQSTERVNNNILYGSDKEEINNNFEYSNTNEKSEYNTNNEQINNDTLYSNASKEIEEINNEINNLQMNDNVVYDTDDTISNNIQSSNEDKMESHTKNIDTNESQEDIDVSDNNDDLLNNTEINTSKYDTPQDILFKFADDQRKAIFGESTQKDNNISESNTENTSDNTISILYQNNNKIKQELNGVDNNITHSSNEYLEEISESINKINNNDNLDITDNNNQTVRKSTKNKTKSNDILANEEPVIKKKIARKKKVLEENIDNNTVAQITDNTLIEEGIISKKATSRKKKVSIDNKDIIESNNEINNKPSRNKKQVQDDIVLDEINKEIDAINQGIDEINQTTQINVEDTKTKVKKTRTKKVLEVSDDTIDDNIQVKKVTRTRKKKDTDNTLVSESNTEIDSNEETSNTKSTRGRKKSIK